MGEEGWREMGPEMLDWVGIETGKWISNSQLVGSGLSCRLSSLWLDAIGRRSCLSYLYFKMPGFCKYTTNEVLSTKIILSYV